MQGLWQSCLKALSQLEKIHGLQIVKYQRKASKTLRTPLGVKFFFDPQCESPMNVDEMEVEFSLLSRARLESNKGKGWQPTPKKI